MAATSNQQHSLIYRVIGAAKAATENRRVQRSLQNLSRGVAQFKAGLLGMRGMMMGFAASIVAIGLGLRRTVTAYSEYTQAQSRLRTTLAASTNMQRQNAQITSMVAERVAVDLGYSLTEANDAMTTMVQTGIGVHASMRLVSSSLRLARIAEMDTENATRFLVDTMNMFRSEMIGPDGTSITLREFADTMSGQLAVAANSASTDIEQLQQAFRYAGTEMSALGYKSHEVMSALAGLSVVGLRGTTAGTRLRGAVAALIRPSERVKQQIAEVTGNTEAWSQIVHNERGRLRSLPDMMAQLMNIMGQLPTQQQRAQLEVAIFGRRALAAGISISEYNEAARRMLSINEEIQDSENVRNRLMRMEEERMRSFGMQMQQLKEGATDLAIAFGEILFGSMDDSREGFGTYIREVAQGIRYLGLMEDGNEDAAEGFAALSPRVRENARNVRELFSDMAKLIKTAWGITKWIMDFTQRHPYLVASIIAIRVAFGGLVPAAGKAAGALGWILKGSLASAAGITLLTIGLTVLGAYLANIAIPHIQRFGEEMTGSTGAMERFRQENTYFSRTWAEQLPIIGNIAAAWVDIANGIKMVIDVVRGNRSIFDAVSFLRGGPTAEERVDRRVTRRTTEIGKTAAQGTTLGQMEEEALRHERMVSAVQLATNLYAEGTRGFDEINSRLKDFGFAGAQRGEVARELSDIQLQRKTAIEAEVARMEEQRTAFGPNMTDAANRTGREFRQLTTQAASAASALRTIGNTSVTEEGMSIPDEDFEFAEDAYVRRGGLMGVSSGDLIVSRDRLADAIFASRGEMAGPAVGAATSQMTGPSPSAATGGGGELNITIPVVIDGREIARANGRANIRQLERGGGRLPPGQRRSLRETGFNRVV